jgi:hypothetical protein
MPTLTVKLSKQPALPLCLSRERCRDGQIWISPHKGWHYPGTKIFVFDCNHKHGDLNQVSNMFWMHRGQILIDAQTISGPPQIFPEIDDTYHTTKSYRPSHKMKNISSCHVSLGENDQ